MTMGGSAKDRRGHTGDPEDAPVEKRIGRQAHRLAQVPDDLPLLRLTIADTQLDPGDVAHLVGPRGRARPIPAATATVVETRRDPDQEQLEHEFVEQQDVRGGARDGDVLGRRMPRMVGDVGHESDLCSGADLALDLRGERAWMTPAHRCAAATANLAHCQPSARSPSVTSSAS